MAKKEKLIIVYILASILGLLIGQGTFKLVHPKHKQEFNKKIESAETYYEEAKAISLSMSLLGDSIIDVYADSLLSVLVHLNHDWVIYVKTQKGFEKYTDGIEELNETLNRLRMQFDMERSMRNIRRDIMEMELWQRNWVKESRKYST